MIKWKIRLLQIQGKTKQTELKLEDIFINFEDWHKIKVFIENLKKEKEKELSYI